MATRTKQSEDAGLKIENWPLSKLLRYANNSRDHSEAQIDQIAASIKEFGFVNPCLIDAGGVLIAGHGRVAGAQKLGLESVPVIKLGHLTETQARALRISDNAIALNSTWNLSALKIELEALKLADFPMDLVGFDNIQLVSFMSGLPGAEKAPRGDATKLSERFGVPPFSVLNAREGWWQERKRAWIALGIQSELGRGETPSTSARVGPDDPTTYRPIGGRKADAIPGGAGKNAARRRRGAKPNAIPGGGMLPLDRVKRSRANATPGGGNASGG
jgi:hypothetical protein